MDNNRLSFGDKKIRSAFRIAELHLRKFQKHFKQPAVLISNIYPYHEPFNKIPTLFEVALQDGSGRQSGYIWVALTKNLPPVPKFSFTGKTVYDQLRSMVGSGDFVPVVFTPFYIVAEDAKGRLLAEYGDRPSLLDKGEKKSKKFDYERFKKCFADHKPEKLEVIREGSLHKWKKILKRDVKKVEDASEVDYLEPSDVPNYDFQVVTAHFPEFLLRCTQIDPGMGANSSHNFHSGCTSCAWMSLIGYHDNIYTLDLLRGTHYTRGDSNSYVSRVLVQLSEYLGTEGTKNGSGSVSPGDIHKGFGFIENVLHHTIRDKDKKETSGIPALQLVYDYLCYYGVPSVISLPGHTVVAYEVLADRNDDRGDHYIRVYQGWGGSASDDPYITYEFIDDGAWSLSGINTKHEVNTGYKSLATPAVIELGDPQYVTELVIALRLPNQNIGLLYSQDGKAYALRYEIPATGTTPPSLAVEGYRNDPYVAWIEADGSLCLAQVNPKVNRVVMLPAPLAVSIRKLGPAIHMFKDKLFYVWDDNIAYTKRENFERSGRPWASEYGYEAYHDAYLGPLGLVNPKSAPSLVSDGARLYLSFLHQAMYFSEPRMLVISLGSNGYLHYHADSAGSTLHTAEARLLFWSKTLYGTTYGAIAEISRALFPTVTKETKYYPYGIGASSVNIGVFSSYEIGPSVFTIYLRDDNVLIRFHSIDRDLDQLDYTGWP